jgi:hypothetical protein
MAALASAIDATQQPLHELGDRPALLLLTAGRTLAIKGREVITLRTRLR